MLFKLKSVFVSTGHDSDKPERINISILSGCCLCTLCFNTMKHFRFGDKIEASLNLFFFIYFQGSEFSRSVFGCHENSDPGKQIKKIDLNSSQSYYPKCFYGHAMFIGGNSQKGLRYLPFPFYRCRVPWIQNEFNLNIIATLSLISISSVKKFASKCPQTWSQLRLMNAKAGEPRHLELCGLDVTICARYDWSVARQLTSFPLRHWNLRNLTLQQECYLTSTRAFFRTFAQLYNAAVFGIKILEGILG